MYCACHTLSLSRASSSVEHPSKQMPQQYQKCLINSSDHFEILLVSFTLLTYENNSETTNDCDVVNILHNRELKMQCNCMRCIFQTSAGTTKQ